MNSVPELPFDLKRSIFRWGPVPGRFFYTSVFTEVNYKYFCQKYLGEQWPEALFLFKEGQMLWLNDDADLRASGRRVFCRFMLPRDSRAVIYREWYSYVRELEMLWGAILPEPLQAMNEMQFQAIWEKFHQIYRDFWITGTVPELANYGSDAYLSERLSEYIGSERERRDLMEILTAPTRMSFYKEEEIALANTADMAVHQSRYFWLKNSYAGTQVLPVAFFAERKKEIPTLINTVAGEQSARTVERKKQAQSEFHLPAEIMEIADAIGDGIGWQDERKKYIFMALHYQDVMLREVARRYGYDYHDLHNAWFYEIGQIISGEDLKDRLFKRNQGFGVRFYRACQELEPEAVKYYWKMYVREHLEGTITKVSGVVASIGKATLTEASVRIVLDPAKVEDFKSGEILVAPMTSPEYIFAMQEAVAIITDTGGLTSHAAIVSRELGIPCLVGTKHATRLFKTGDRVRVDTANGTAAKIN